MEIQRRPHTLKEVASMMKMSQNGAKSWIKTFIPEIYEKCGKRKNLFTQKEVADIMREFFV